LQEINPSSNTPNLYNPKMDHSHHNHHNNFLNMTPKYYSIYIKNNLLILTPIITINKLKINKIKKQNNK